MAGISYGSIIINTYCACDYLQSSGPSTPSMAARRLDTANTFTFDGQLFTLTERRQLVNVKGSMWTGGRKTFVRGYDQDLDHDESALGMLQRINRDAAKHQVRSSRGWLLCTCYAYECA